MTLDAALRRAPAWQRLGAALACSLALHAWLLAMLRPPAPSRGVFGAALSASLTEGKRAAREPRPAVREAAKTLPSPVARSSESPAPATRAVAAVAPVERAGRSAPWVSAGPASAPRNPPASGLADADAYLGERELSGYPMLPPGFAVVYPPKALAERRRGEVIVQLMVEADGSVAEALALPGAPEDLAAAALEALRSARFEPARGRNGERVRARAYFRASFVIE